MLYSNRLQDSSSGKQEESKTYLSIPSHNYKTFSTEQELCRNSDCQQKPLGRPEIEPRADTLVSLMAYLMGGAVSCSVSFTKLLQSWLHKCHTEQRQRGGVVQSCLSMWEEQQLMVTGLRFLPNTPKGLERAPSGPCEWQRNKVLPWVTP